jgi:hypothetical protein
MVRLDGDDEEGVLYHRFNSRVMHRYLCMIYRRKTPFLEYLDSTPT